MKTIYLVLVLVNPLQVSVIEAPNAEQCFDAATDISLNNRESDVTVASFCSESDNVKNDSLNELLDKRLQQ